MNRIGSRELAPDAARLFEAEVRSLAPDIDRNELCDMVDDFIYYQTDDLTRREAHELVDRTCRSGRDSRSGRLVLTIPSRC